VLERKILRDVETLIQDPYDSLKFEVHKPTVYLCGGFYGDWNTKIKHLIGHRANILDPRDWKQERLDYKYVPRDLQAIELSDIIFAYRQATNPALGMTYELGYANALGKYTIFLGEYENITIKRYLSFCRVGSSYIALDFEDAVLELNKALNAWDEVYNQLNEGAPDNEEHEYNHFN